jgi:cbb3-type cytochrome oxidase subunit 3
LNSNIAGVRKRATAIGIQQTVVSFSLFELLSLSNGFSDVLFPPSQGNCGGILAGQIYRSEGKPRYILGHAFSLGSMVLALVLLTVEVWIYKSRNAKKLAMTEEEKDAEDAEGKVIGDRHHSFQYVY